RVGVERESGGSRAGVERVSGGNREGGSRAEVGRKLGGSRAEVEPKSGRSRAEVVGRRTSEEDVGELREENVGRKTSRTSGGRSREEDVGRKTSGGRHVGRKTSGGRVRWNLFNTIIRNFLIINFSREFFTFFPFNHNSHVGDSTKSNLDEHSCCLIAQDIKCIPLNDQKRINKGVYRHHGKTTDPFLIFYIISKFPAEACSQPGCKTRKITLIKNHPILQDVVIYKKCKIDCNSVVARGRHSPSQSIYYNLIVHKNLKNTEHPRNLIPELCRLFYNLGWVTGTGGGISIKHGKEIYIAPSGVQKERIQGDELFVQDIEGHDLELPPPEKKLKKSQCTPLFMCAYTGEKAKK
ncbi:hypothetical protein L9F63_019809, partial [Diploptera punctata]